VTFVSREVVIPEARAGSVIIVITIIPITVPLTVVVVGPVVAKRFMVVVLHRRPIATPIAAARLFWSPPQRPDRRFTAFPLPPRRVYQFTHMVSAGTFATPRQKVRRRPPRNCHGIAATPRRTLEPYGGRMAVAVDC